MPTLDDNLFLFSLTCIHLSPTFLVVWGLLSGLFPALSVAVGLLGGTWGLTYLAM